MNPRGLILYDTYTRQDVHDIFSPETHFVPSAGTWGLWGIVPIPSKSGDIVLFVTFGNSKRGMSLMNGSVKMALSIGNHNPAKPCRSSNSAIHSS
jgi:hypothetical protein